MNLYPAKTRTLRIYRLEVFPYFDSCQRKQNFKGKTIMGVNHPDIEVLKFTLNVVGKEPEDVQVKGNDDIHFNIPEGTEYHMTIHFIVKTRVLKDLQYKQEVKKAGFVVRSREVKIGPEFEPREEPYVVDFEKDTTPSGFMYRGSFNCTSTYRANDEVLFSLDWTLTVSKK